MKERPIIFSAPMVRAILDGRKTQTRRAIKPQPTVSEQRLRELGAWADDYTLSEQVNAAFQAGCIDAHCPYGRPGDRLWVRETWSIYDYECARRDQPEDVWVPEKRSDLPRPSSLPRETRICYAADNAPGDEMVCYSSIHMPRWASRITLEITGVRVERLQDISAFDALAEGVIDWATGPTSPKQDYRELWESINGPGSWDANPWLWVIEFKRIDAQQVAA